MNRFGLICIIAVVAPCLVDCKRPAGSGSGSGFGSGSGRGTGTGSAVDASPHGTRQKPIRYPLPATHIPPEIRARLDPWIAGFIGLTTEQADARLKERWASIERPSLVALRDTLMKFEVREIVDAGGGGMIFGYRPGSTDEGIGDFWYLPAALEREDIARRLEPFGLQENVALREFLHHFGGLAEDVETAGHFVHRDRPWEPFRNSEENHLEEAATEGFQEWKDSLMLYHARNGCFILVRRDGKVGWWVMQEAMVTLEAEDFDGFIHLFNEHRKRSWPFDPYGIPDDA